MQAEGQPRSGGGRVTHSGTSGATVAGHAPDSLQHNFLAIAIPAVIAAIAVACIRDGRSASAASAPLRSPAVAKASKA